MLLAFLSLTCGLILDTVTQGPLGIEAHGLSRHSRARRSPTPIAPQRAQRFDKP